MSFRKYNYFRLLRVYAVVLVEYAFDQLGVAKTFLVQRMFWGRGSLYKTSFHLSVFGITAIVLVSGISERLVNTAVSAQGFSTDIESTTNTDILAQGSNLTSVLPVNQDAPNYNVFKYTVVSGDTLDSIATKFNLHSADTIIWANDKVINPFSLEIHVGLTLDIPEIDGVLYTVKAGDTVDSIVAKTRGSDRFSVIELNNLLPPNYDLIVGQKIFVPSGELAPPALPGLLKGYFEDPLSNPACAGYAYMRGMTAYHSGIDLAIGGGCPIRAIAAGTVEFAGWHDSASGNTVIIDHGGGIKSYYLHGNGEFWVRKGDYVKKGQDIMHMGSTGNSTGTHLHLSLRKNGVLVDPADYVPYRRSRY